MTQNPKKKVAVAPPEARRRLINYQWVVKNIPFFIFLGLLAVLYIYNGHHADKMVRKISEGEKRIKDMEYEYKTVQSEVIYRSKASELVKIVEPLGLKESFAPPITIKDSVSQ